MNRSLEGHRKDHKKRLGRSGSPIQGLGSSSLTRSISLGSYDQFNLFGDQFNDLRYDSYGTLNGGYTSGDKFSWQRYTSHLPIECRFDIEVMPPLERSTSYIDFTAMDLEASSTAQSTQSRHGSPTQMSPTQTQAKTHTNDNEFDDDLMNNSDELDTLNKSKGGGEDLFDYPKPVTIVKMRPLQALLPGTRYAILLCNGTMTVPTGFCSPPIDTPSLATDTDDPSFHWNGEGPRLGPMLPIGGIDCDPSAYTLRCVMGDDQLYVFRTEGMQEDGDEDNSTLGGHSSMGSLRSSLSQLRKGSSMA